MSHIIVYVGVLAVFSFSQDVEGGFLLVSGQGMGDVGQEDWWGSWNCSRTDGKLQD